MTKRYTGGVVSSSLPTVNAAGASGVFLLSQQADYQSRNAWPPYKVEESLRFRSSASASLSRTPASATNRTTWTWSGWIKRGDVSTSEMTFFSAGTDNNNFTALAWNNNNLFFQNYTSGTQVTATSTAVFRDPSAWYHVVLAIDTTQATAADRAKIYVNGVQQAGFSGSSLTLNQQFWINFTYRHTISARSLSSIDSFTDQYMSEINFVDGQALAPSSFGATDKDGNWSPIAYTGTYGTNGFYVNFRDSTSAATMGYDYSGNGNNWTLNGFNVSTANTTYDIMIDVPEDQSDGTANNRGNYCTINPLLDLQTQATYSEGNLKLTTSPSGGFSMRMLAKGTIQIPSTGKWYFTMTGNTNMNITNDTGNRDQYGTSISGTNVRYTSAGTVLLNGDTYATVASFSATDEVGMAIDMDASTVAIYKNGALQNTVFSAITSEFTYFPMMSPDSSSTAAVGTFNFGQRPFAYEPPSGFKTLNTFNLPEPTIKQPNKHFDALLWTGDGNNGRNITGYGFSPEFLWIKKRSGSEDHKLNDIVRGVDKQLMSNRTEPEYTNTDQVRAFLSNGFTTDSSGSTNGSGATYVGWAWNAGGSTVTNTAGSITSQVRANPTAGFSIVTYTGTGANATVGHGLGVAPSMVIVKSRISAVNNWNIYNANLTSAVYKLLFTDNAETSDATSWNSTAPTSSVFSLGTNTGTNANTETFVAYCFAQVAGYSAIGKYTGNGSSDGPFIYTGFRPRFLLIKNSSTTVDWVIEDTSRDPYNIVGTEIFPNLSNAESSGNADLDILSNGFKIRRNSTFANGSGNTIIYAAFAEAPFKYARSR